MFVKIWSFITKAFSHLVLISSTTCLCWKYILHIEIDITHMHTLTHVHTLQASAWPSLENSRFIRMQGTFNQSFLFAFLLIKNYSSYGMWTITYSLSVGLSYPPLFFSPISEIVCTRCALYFHVWFGSHNGNDFRVTEILKKKFFFEWTGDIDTFKHFLRLWEIRCYGRKKAVLILANFCLCVCMFVCVF